MRGFMREIRLGMFLVAIAAGCPIEGAPPATETRSDGAIGIAPVDSAAIPSGKKVRIEGLDRLHFSEHGSGDSALSSNRNMAILLPLFADAKIGKLERTGGRSWLGDVMAGDSGSDWWAVQANHSLPEMFPGHKLMLREAGIHAYTLNDRPIHLALYDNDRRTYVWSYWGSSEKILPDYRIHAILPDGSDRVKIRLQGTVFRNRYWEVKGVELTFRRTEDALVLETVVSPFTFLSGGEIQTESVSRGAIVTRTIPTVSRRVSEVCQVRNPVVDNDWEFDWQKLSKSATCAVRRQRANKESRSVGAPSFLEVGWRRE